MTADAGDSEKRSEEQVGEKLGFPFGFSGRKVEFAPQRCSTA